MISAAAFLDGLTVKNGSSWQGLWIFPVCLISPEFEKNGTEFSPLSEGIARGTARALETGSMERMLIVNNGPRPLAALEGETLEGGAQSRLISAGAAVAPGAEAELPSCCVEVRRWDCRPGAADPIPDDKKTFRRADFSMGSLRRARMASAAKSAGSGGLFAPNQKDVWEHIVRLFGESGAASRALDLHDLYEHWDSPIRSFCARFSAFHNQTGLIAFLDKDIWFADIFANRDMFLKYFRGVVRGHCFDALLRLERGHNVPPSKSPGPDSARDALKRIKLARSTSFEIASASGIFLSSPRILGCALTNSTSILHLSACSR
ncbi:MAG TPA: hypothetical protein PKH33_17160 [bacterium]|nr:hypothetical protein [bacterium]